MPISDWLRKENNASHQPGRRSHLRCPYGHWVKNPVVRKCAPSFVTLLHRKFPASSLLRACFTLEATKANSWFFRNLQCFLKETGTVFEIQEKHLHLLSCSNYYRVTILHVDCHQQDSQKIHFTKFLPKSSMGNI